MSEILYQKHKILNNIRYRIPKINVASMALLDIL